MEVLKADYANIYQKLSSLYDLQLEGKGNSEMFSIKEKELSEQLKSIKKAMETCGMKYESIVPRAKETFLAINNLEQIYNMADNFEKAKILKLLANQYTLEGKEIKVDYKEPFCYFAQAKKELQPSSGRIVELPIFDPKKIPSFTDDNSGSSRDSIWGTLIDYIYNYFSVNIIYWDVLLLRRERVMRNGTIGPSYNFMDMIRGN